MFDADLQRHRREFARAVANKHYEITPGGILFPAQKALIAGHFESWLNGGEHSVDPNIIPTEGQNYALSAIVGNGAQVGPWNVALFSANVTPGLTLTGATFVAVCTEFTGYAEATRVPYVEGTPAGGVVDNDASRAEFTINASATLYGGALLEASAKSAVTGKILAAAKFAASRAVQSGDTLQVKYTLTLTSS